MDSLRASLFLNFMKDLKKRSQEIYVRYWQNQCNKYTERMMLTGSLCPWSALFPSQSSSTFISVPWMTITTHRFVRYLKLCRWEEQQRCNENLKSLIHPWKAEWCLSFQRWNLTGVYVKSSLWVKKFKCVCMPKTEQQNLWEVFKLW